MKCRPAPLLAALALLIVACAARAGAHAQGAALIRQSCPTISISAPDSVRPGEPLTFTASISGAAPGAKPSYRWTVSAGDITEGQGTSSVTVDTTGLGNLTLTAAVEVEGFGPECALFGEREAAVISTPVCRCDLDSYGDISFEDEQARLDNFAIAVLEVPGSQGYIIAYGGRRGRRGEAAERGERARDYLVSRRGIEPARIVVLDGGYRDELTVVLSVVPPGVHPPAASPTVDPSEVEIIPDPKK